MEENVGVQLIGLPFEIYEHILLSESITFNDIGNFRSTCTHFWQLVKRSNLIWKFKFKQIWPQLLRNNEFKQHTVTDWQSECRQRMVIGKKTMEVVYTMSDLHMSHDELSVLDFKRFEDIFTTAEHKLALVFMIDELMMCVNNKDRNTNLTNKYYCEKALRHIRQIDLTNKWQAFKNAPAEKQILERGAVLIAQWSQPSLEITDDSIGSELNALAEEVRKRILLEHGEEHAALCVPKKLQAQWQTHNLPDNYYKPYVSRQVIQAVSAVLFKDLGFYGNSELYYSPENSYINKVLEHRRGIPITLSILFESITRRLGVKCEPVSFPGHFLLRWRDTYKENVQTQYFYIDVFNGGVFLGKESCPQFSTSQSQCPMGDIFRFGPATALQVAERMANNLEMAGRQRTVMNGRSTRLRSSLELLHMINPTNLNCLLQLLRFYMQHMLDVSPLRQSVEDSVNQFDVREIGQASYILRTLKDYCDNLSQFARDETEVSVKRRDENTHVAYAVGMVMHHRQYDYTCVIMGWDPRCMATEDWMLQMNISSLSRKHHQPFYHVLVNDGTNRYAAEENLEVENPTRDCWVTHCEVGRYFDTFCGLYYRPNPSLLKLYPDDPPVAAAIQNPN